MMLHNDHPFHISTLYPPILGKSSRHIAQCFFRNLELVGDPVPIFEEVKMFRLLDPSSLSPPSSWENYLIWMVGIFLRNRPIHLPLQLCSWGDLPSRWGDIPLRWEDIRLKWDNHFIFILVVLFLINRPINLHLMVFSHSAFPPSLPWSSLIIVAVLAIALLLHTC